jgi:RimJ/RimL family protein N-acetyltransferase
MHAFALTAQDVPRYRKLMLEAYVLAEDAFTSTASERENEPDSWWANRIAHPEGLGVSFGIQADDRLVGTVALEYSPKAKTQHSALLIGMYVSATARGHGAGRKLLRAALDHACNRAGLKVVTLTVTEGNTPAIRLYESEGFVAWGTQPLAIRTTSQYRGKVHMSRILSA